MTTSSKKVFLYDLIRSMTKDEKQFCTRYLILNSGNRNKLGSEVFSIINQNRQKNDQVLDEKLSGFKNISKLKNDLYHILLEALSLYMSKSLNIMNLRMRLNKVSMLFQRGLHEACAKLIEETLKQCKKYEATEIQLELLQYKSRVAKYSDRKKDRLSSSLKQYKNTFEMQTQEVEAFILQTETVALYRELGEAPAFEQKSKMEHIYETAMRYREEAISFKAKYRNNFTLAVCSDVLGENNDELDAFQENYDFFKASPELKKYHVNKHATAINNLAVAHNKRNHTDQAISILNELDNFNKLTPYQQELLFQYKAGNLLSIHLQSGRLNGIEPLTEWIESNLNEKEGQLLNVMKIVGWSNLQQYYMWTGNYHKCKKIIQFLITTFPNNLRNDIIRYAHFQNLMVWLESEEYEYVHGLMQNLKAKFKKTNEMEKSILRMVKKIVLRREPLHKIYKEEELNFLDVFSDELVRKQLTHFNLLIWIRMKNHPTDLQQAFEQFTSQDYDSYKEDRRSLLISE